MQKCQDYIFKNINKVTFRHDILLAHPKNIAFFNDFIIEENIINNTSFNVQKVIGTDHPDYVGKSWQECLENLKRPRNLSSLRCDQNRPSINYYMSDIQKEHWSVDIINDDIYITQGNHRTIISKFLSFLNITPCEQKNISFVRHIKYNRKSHRKFLKLYKTIQNLQDEMEFFIQISVSKKQIREIENHKTYQTIYVCKINTECSCYEENFVDFNEFKDFVFKQIRVFYKPKNIDDYLQVGIICFKKLRAKIMALFQED